MKENSTSAFVCGLLACICPVGLYCVQIQQVGYYAFCAIENGKHLNGNGHKASVSEQLSSLIAIHIIATSTHKYSTNIDTECFDVCMCMGCTIEYHLYFK